MRNKLIEILKEKEKNAQTFSSYWKNVSDDCHTWQYYTPAIDCVSDILNIYDDKVELVIFETLFEYEIVFYSFEEFINKITSI